MVLTVKFPDDCVGAHQGRMHPRGAVNNVMQSLSNGKMLTVRDGRIFGQLTLKPATALVQDMAISPTYGHVAVASAGVLEVFHWTGDDLEEKDLVARTSMNCLGCMYSKCGELM